MRFAGFAQGRVPRGCGRTVEAVEEGRGSVVRPSGLADCARIGNVLAAFALEGTGDWETLPRLTDIVDQLRPELRSVAS